MTNELAARLIGLVAQSQAIDAEMIALIAASEVGRVTPAGGLPMVVPEDGTQTERVVAFMGQRTMGTVVTRGELREAFPDLNNNSLSGVLTRLKDRGQVEAVGRGRYRLRRSSSR